ncbi:TPA: hypothetical protein ACGF3Z_003439, partial [Vibrio cholerae]
YLAFRLSFIVYVDLQMNASFNQRMHAIKPYISQKEYDLLYSGWALMVSKKDYIEINARLTLLGENAQLTLPEIMYK